MKYPVSLHALESAIGRNPVTFGSRVPKCDAFFSLSFFLTKSQTSKDVGPDGLSILIIPNSISSSVLLFF
jgi:hypothetical protein